MNGFRYAVVTVKRSLKLSYKPPTHERVTKYREAFVPNVVFFCEKGRWVGLGRVVEDERGPQSNSARPRVDLLLLYSAAHSAHAP